MIDAVAGSILDFGRGTIQYFIEIVTEAGRFGFILASIFVYVENTGSNIAFTSIHSLGNIVPGPVHPCFVNRAEMSVVVSPRWIPIALSIAL
ncbi:hypothetical protein C474_14424 [Halogeometricum pallidum JCM 14848]|uniref:Uncharacterized protein n=1 Tax=Halogeometricum pallidum JCM 14848 TaxID=1227487 RepID=M0D3G8_HALPD|nr:hypothetical protein C474_14424 [Halogeometricum pallidum JCM 14848]